MASQNEFVTLYYQGGGSDKVYQASLEGTNNGGFMVNFAFGRRGTSLNQGSKTTTPVPYSKAKKIYDQLVYSKEAKGYTPGPFYTNGLPLPAATPAGNPAPSTSAPASTTTKPTSTVQASAPAKKVSINSATNFSGITPQLLNVITEEEALALLEDDDWLMQEKKDGTRKMAEIIARTVKGINRKGSNVCLANDIVGEAANCPEDVLIDGEDVNCKLWVFDILKRGSEDLRKLPYEKRFEHLNEICQFYFDPAHIETVPTAFTTGTKKALFEQWRNDGVEGVVFKLKSSLYVPGRPASGGDQLKFKFYETASAFVTHQNAQRSVAMAMYDGTTWHDVGNVTIPPNKDIPAAGKVIEVRYLYAYQGGALYQPVYIGERDDIDKDECVLDQLKYKTQTI